MRALLLAASVAAGLAATRRTLPDGPLSLSYPGDGICNSKVVTAVQQGLNVVVWSFIEVIADAQGNPSIDLTLGPMPDLACVGQTVQELKKQNLTTVHMVSIGGWGEPHPVTTGGGAAVYAAWKEWNEKVVAANGFTFDGVDWDLEGVNTLSSPNNNFTVACLDMVGVFSQLAKADGYLVSLVPPESYFDVTTSAFDRSLTHPYPDWESIGQDFSYHGHNSYAYIVSRYASTKLPTGETVPTYDWYAVQLYESYSHANFNITQLGQNAAEYLEAYAKQLYAGWAVDFSSDPAVGYPTTTVSVKPSQLLIGFANGWADGDKVVFIDPADVGAAYTSLAAKGQQFRGVFYWCIDSDGTVPVGEKQPLYMARAFNDFLHIR